MPLSSSAENESIAVASDDYNDIPPQYASKTYSVTQQSNDTTRDVGEYSSIAHQPQQYVIVQQSGPAVLWSADPLQNSPKDYLLYSVLATVFCCPLFGIFSIVSSFRYRSAIAAGDRATAEIKSRDARCWASMSFTLGASVAGYQLFRLLIFCLSLLPPTDDMEPSTKSITQCNC
jgi:hypothetical protein